jgi:hypothetical protein
VRAQLADVTTTLADAQALLLKHVGADTLLCGHSLENDLHALQLIHERIVDTSVSFPRGDGRNAASKHSLRYLASKYLNRAIQTEASHSPIEDAAAALALVEHCAKHGNGGGGGPAVGAPLTESLLTTLTAQGHAATMIDRHGLVARFTHATQADAVACVDDDAVAAALPSAIAGRSRFVWAQLSAFAPLYEARADEIMQQLAAPPSTSASAQVAAANNDDDDDALSRALRQLEADSSSPGATASSSAPTLSSGVVRPGALLAQRFAQDTGALIAALSAADRVARSVYDVLQCYAPLYHFSLLLISIGAAKRCCVDHSGSAGRCGAVDSMARATSRRASCRNKSRSMSSNRSISLASFVFCRDVGILIMIKIFKRCVNRCVSR